MIPARERRERMIKMMGERQMRSALEYILWRRRKSFALLDLFDDETIEELAREVLTAERRRQRDNAKSRAWHAARRAEQTKEAAQ